MGLEIVDDEEVEVEVDRIEEDEEVARIYEGAKDKHQKNNDWCTVCNTQMHVEDVKDTQMYMY